MELFLIRHPQPDIAKGICYGQSDLELVEGALEDTLNSVCEKLPLGLPIISSPLKRCRLLAEKLGNFTVDDRLIELNFGEWELMKWDEIPGEDLEKWMINYLEERPPNGETGNELHHRVGNFFNDIDQSYAIVGHMGSFRSLYAHANKISLPDAFKTFKMEYGEMHVLSLK